MAAKGIVPDSPFKSDLLKDQVALVVGGGTGICFDIAMTLGIHGAKIGIMGRREAILKGAVEKLQQQGIAATYFSGDVRKFDKCEESVKHILKTFGKLDLLVNGAAGNFLCPLEGMSANAFKAVIEIDLVGTFNMSKAAFESLKATKGNIINISATLHYGATPLVGHASAAKAAIDSLTRSMAVEWGEYGIRINGVAPGWTEETEGFDRLIGDHAQSFTETIPLGRPCTKRDISLTCLFLASSAAGTISGAVVVNDGAGWLWRPSLAKKTRFLETAASTLQAAAHAKPLTPKL